MKMPSNEVSMTLTQKLDVPPPPQPVKGEYPWGVGKVYRRCRREYAKQMRKWRRGPKTMTQTIYVPFAQIEMVMARNEEDAEVRQMTKSVTAEFTITPNPAVRELLFGN